jgi:hypothetical protein
LPNDTHHIGIAGDCGTATAVRQADESYRFNLEHKAAYLCFLPFIGNDLGRTVLKKIVVRSDSAIAGVFTLDPERGMMPKEDTTHVITLTTGDFVLPRTVNQNTAAYMVIAPQRGSARLTCEFWVYDTQLQSEGVFTRMVDLDEICSNMVYVVKANCNNYVVDLGLPVKFLNHNMSAFAPEEYGGYYSYGELENKGNYSTGNYSYQNTSYSDIADIRLTDKDVAHVRLGGNFSLPTSEELNMLKDSCTWVWESSFNGKAGYKITGKNGNTLFMPAGGYRNNADNPSEYPTRGLYRTSQLIASGQKSNWFLSFKSNSKSVEHSTNLFHGYSIRPVVSTGMTMTDGTLVQVATDSVQWTLNQLSAKLFGTVYGINKSKTPVEIGFVTGATAEVTEADAKCIVKAAATTANGKFSADFSMPKDTAYYYRAYAKDQDGNIEYGAALQFGRIYVDLGLPSGTKWANISLGTVAPYQNGNYYAWGETSTKASYPNDASNYRWYSHSTWIEPDRLLEIQATDNDAASVNWGDCWMTPDKQDIQELIENCDFAASTMNGVKGYTITSRMNGNSLFMPLSGWLNTAPNSYASDGFFASSSLPGVTNYAGRADYAALLGNTSVSYWYRTDGVPVRPVYKTNATSADNKPMFVRTLVAAKQYDGQTETNTLKATVRGLEGTTNTTVGFSYSTDPDFATDTKVTVEKSTDGQYSYVFNATEPGVRTYYRAFVCSNGTYYYGKTLKVDAVGLVDLGLSVLWANVDIGSARPTASTFSVLP